MGCHTYINYPAKKQDKIKQVFLDRMKDDISEIQKHYTNKKYWIKLKKELKMLSDKDVGNGNDVYRKHSWNVLLFGQQMDNNRVAR